MTIYRYGGLAWLWRILGLGAAAAGVFLLAAALRFDSWTFVAMALPLLAPPALLGPMVATRVDRVGDELTVRTLAFVTRTIPREALGPPRLRRKATALVTQVHAPRLWVPVRGGPPIYLDLLAEIPDLEAFRAAFPLPRDIASALRREARS